MSRNTTHVPSQASSSTQPNTIPTAQRLDAEAWAIHDLEQRLNESYATNVEYTKTLSALDAEARNTRDIRRHDEIAAEISLIGAKMRETNREIVAMDKRLKEMRRLNERTARRNRYEQDGRLRVQDDSPSLGLPGTIKVAQYGAQARSGQHDRRR
ncbi:hypothetical protein PENSPDRAFT_682704 [Peniophora sp. CONT]|nr:hypothetical protein PENSPDRAFT_682704 [Peniophora sp. CONT]